jgi:hypothetical protein
MSTVNNTPAYPFDPTGLKVSNKVTGEQQILTPTNPRDAYFIVPKFAPYFGDSLKVVIKDLKNVVRTLVQGVDYYPSHTFMDASFATAKPIYGSITFLDTSLSGIVTLVYQTVGDVWVQDDATIALILADRLSNPRTTSWDRVANLPKAFPSIDHQYDLIDMKGLDSLVTSVDALTQAVLSTAGSNLAAHKAATGNVHGMVPGDIGAYSKTETAALVDTKITAAIAAHVATMHQ